MNLFGKWLAKKDASEESLKTLESLLKGMREAAIVVNQETQIIASNQKAYDAFARQNGRLETKRLSEAIRDLSIHEAFRMVLRENSTTEIRYEPPGNDRKIYSLYIRPLEFQGHINALGIFYDKTQVEKLEIIRQEFLSNVSHELRTPLTAIMAYVETLEDGAINDKENNRHFLSIISKNALRMSHLIADILELSSIEAGKITLSPNQVGLAALVREIFANLSSKAAGRGIKLKNAVNGDFSVYADAIRLEQVLTNLIDNAIKFNREKGIVSVYAEVKGDSRLIHVSDQGEGIAPEHKDRIFERFYRTDKARSRDIGGTGLGLAIVKHLVRLHGGDVSFSSTLGEQTVFTVELPQPGPGPSSL